MLQLLLIALAVLWVAVAVIHRLSVMRQPVPPGICQDCRREPIMPGSNVCETCFEMFIW